MESPTSQDRVSEVTMQRATENPGAGRAEWAQREERAKMSRLYSEEPLQGKFRIEGGAFQLCPVTGKNRGMLGKSGSQVCFG